MRLEDCNLNVDQAVSAPLKRTEPERVWVEAWQSGVLPQPVFQLYEQAQYLSFGAAPRFLADPENVLFSYFGIVLESVRGSLVEAEEHRHVLVEAEAGAYDVGKKIRGESWDPTATERSRRAFRYFLLSQQAALDAVADLTAILLTGPIPGLRVGRAQFSRVESWLRRPLPATGLVITPREYFLRQLYDVLGPLVHPDSPERDWLPLMRLYRNKSAHLGSSVFRQIGLHDNSGRFYMFIPRQWPYIWERHLKPAGTPVTGPPLPDLFRETLIHQDLLTYAEGLRNKVAIVVEAAVSVLRLAYHEFREFPLNDGALAELYGSSESYKFEYFVDV